MNANTLKKSNKTAVIPKNEPGFVFVKSFDITALRAELSNLNRDVVLVRRNAFRVGLMLIQLKESVQHGQFQSAIEDFLSDLITVRQAQNYMLGAQNLLAARPLPKAVDIEASVVIATEDKKLSPAALEWKQQTLALWNQTTIKNAATGVFVDGDEAHRIARAINGKTKGGRGNGSVSRKAFPLFVSKHLRCVSASLFVAKPRGKFRQLDADQCNQIGAAFSESMKRWPRWLVASIVAAGKQELNLSDEQRITRAMAMIESAKLRLIRMGEYGKNSHPKPN